MDLQPTIIMELHLSGLSVEFRLKEVVTLEEIKTKFNLHGHFWFEKRNKVGNLDRISGHTVYPMSDSKVRASLIGSDFYQPEPGSG